MTLAYDYDYDLSKATTRTIQHNPTLDSVSVAVASLNYHTVSLAAVD